MDMITLEEFKTAPKGIFEIHISDISGKEPWYYSEEDDVLYVDKHLFQHLLSLAEKEGLCNEIRYEYYIECDSCGSSIVDLNAAVYLLDELCFIVQAQDAREDIPGNKLADSSALYDIRWEILDHIMVMIDLSIDERIKYFLETFTDQKAYPYNVTGLNDQGKLCGYSCDRIAVVRMPEDIITHGHSCIVRKMISDQASSR